MKLHLPKRLFTALLTAITLAAAPAALTLGSAAWGTWTATNTYTLDEGDNEIKLSEGKGDASGSVAGMVFVKPNDASDEAGSITSITFDNDTAKQLVITGDWNGAFNFTDLTVGTLNVNVDGATLNIGGNQASNASQVVTINGMTGSNSLSSVTVKAGSSLTLDGNNTTYTGVTTVEAGATLTIKHTKALGSWSNMTADDVLGRVEGAGTLVIDFTDSNPDNIDVAAKGSGGDSSLGGFTGVVDIQRGKLYIGNNPGTPGNDGNAGDFGASKVIVRSGAEFWTHSNSAELTTPQIDLMSGATLGNKDGDKEYTGNIRFNVVDPYATGDAVQYDEDGVAYISAYWGKELKYSGLLEGDGTVKFLNTIDTSSKASGYNDWRVNYYLLNEENKFSGTYELADNEEHKETNNADDEIRLYLEKSGVAQYASINLSSTKATSKLILGADSTIVNLNGSVAKNLVTTKDGVSATLTVSGGSFAGMLQNGANDGILSLTKTGEGTLTLSGTNTYSGTTAINAGVLEITNASALSSSSATTIDANASLLINAGTGSTITFGSSNRVTGAGTLEIASGSTVNLGASSGGTAQIQTNVKINGGGILNLTAADALGWGDYALKKITLLGSGAENGQLAKLTATGDQTMKTALDLQGNTEVSGGAFEFFGGSITASGENNVIKSNIYSRNAGTITVTGLNDVLEVSGNFDRRSSYQALITKSGLGLLKISGASNTFYNGLTVAAGKVEVAGTGSTKVQGAALTVSSGAEFEVSAGTSTLSNGVTNNGDITVSGGSATLSGTVANSGDITVSGGTADFTSGSTLDMGAGSTLSVTDGSATLGGTVTNNGAITVSGGTASFTNTLGMGAGSSLSVSGGSATVSGALNVTGTGVEIAQSGEGVLNLMGQVSVAEGAALTMGGTITLNHTITNDGTLTLNGAIYLTGDITTGFVEKTAGGVTYSGTLEGQEETYNGFKTISGATYKLTQSSDGVSGTVENNLGGNFATDSAGKTVVYHGDDEYEVTSEDGQLYFTTGEITGTEYYITTGDVVVDDAVRAVATGYTLQGGTMKLQGGSVATSNITYTSGSVALSDAATLTIDVADNTETATDWLTNTTGTAGTTIEIAANANFGEVSGSPREYKTSFEGKWVVSNGATLKLGGLDGGYNYAYKVDLLSLESLDLDGGNLRFFGDSAKLGQINVKQAARFDIWEMYDDDSLLNITELNLEANLTMATTWRSHVNIEALTGSGRFVIGSGKTYSTFKANVTDEYTGVFDLNHAADKMYVELNVAENATATIEGDSDTSINKLTLKNGASFDIDTNGANNHGFTYSLGSVGIEDSATIQTTQDHGGWQAEVNIGSLTGNADAVLNIISNTKTTQRSIINLNGGNFDGTVNVTGSSSGGDRKIALNVNDSTVLADAVVSMHGNRSQVALAIGGAEGNSVTLKGINDQENANGTIVIVSGAQDYDTNDEFLTANEYDSHTLVIDTDGSGESDPNATGGTYSTKATISAGLNLQKEGNGKQTFSGDFSRFDGSVTVNGGTLEITTADTSSKSWGITTATVNQGASLRLGGTVTVGSMSAAGSIALDADSILTLGGGTDAQNQVIHNIGTLSAASAGVSLGNHATLSLGDGTHSIGTLSGSTGSTGSKLDLAENAVLNQLGSVTSPVTVTGSGTYVMWNSNTATSNLTGWTEGAWTGTVALEGMSIRGDNATSVHTLGNAGSTIKLSGVSGWINTGDLDANLLLENGTYDYALKIINGSSDNRYDFKGVISGSGDLEYNLGASDRQNFYFYKDISGWKANEELGETPEIRVASGHKLTVYLMDDASTVNVAFVQNKGTLNLVVDTTATFNEDVTVTGLTLNKSATFNANTTASTMEAASSTVTLGENVTLALGAGTNSTQKQHSIGTLTGGTGSVVNLGNYATLTLGDGSSTINHTLGSLSTASNSIVSISSGSNLTLTSVDNVQGDITGTGKLTLDFTNKAEKKIELNHAIFGRELNTLVLTGVGTGLEITSSSTQPTNFGKIQNINVEAGATFYNRVTNTTGWILNPGNPVNISLAGNGDGSTTGAALSLGYDCQKGGTVAFGNNVNFSLSDDATVIVHGKAGNNADIAGVINTTIQGNGHTLTKIGAGKLTLENGASNTSLNVNEGELVLMGAATTSERVELNGGTLKLAEKAAITTKQGSAVPATMSKVRMSSEGIYGTAQDGSSSMSDADIEVLAQDATFTIADMTLTNTSINAATVNTQVSFDNVTVSGAVVLKNLKVAMSGAQVGAGGSEGSMGTFKASTTLLSGITMSAGSSLTVDLGDLSSYAAMGPGKYDLSITLSGFSMDAYTGAYAGSGLQFAADSWLGELLAQGNNANVQISISQAEEGAAAAAAGVSSGSTGVSYSTGNVGMVITITGLNVPEPTTATLSLLALAALAGRRRRK